MSNELQHSRFKNCIPPAAILDNASATTVEIDTLDADYLTVVLNIGATDIAMTALKLTESDTAGSGHADITGATFSGGTNTDGTALALPSATDDNQVCVFQVDLRGRKRYIDIVATFGNGSAGGFIAGTAVLSKHHVYISADTDIADGGCVRV
jgi:hypothetical protein